MGVHRPVLVLALCLGPVSLACWGGSDEGEHCTRHGDCAANLVCCAGSEICARATECGDPGVLGAWNLRYNCVRSDSSLCMDGDQCADYTLVRDPGATDQYADDDEDLSGQLTGNVFRWEAHFGDTPEEAYREVGTWTFSADFATFTQESCYTYDADNGTVDAETITCTGLNRGQCTATGSRGSPGPAPVIGTCAEGPAISPSCP